MLKHLRVTASGSGYHTGLEGQRERAVLQEARGRGHRVKVMLESEQASPKRPGAVEDMQEA